MNGDDETSDLWAVAYIAAAYIAVMTFGLFGSYLQYRITRGAP